MAKGMSRREGKMKHSETTVDQQFVNPRCWNVRIGGEDELACGQKFSVQPPPPHLRRWKAADQHTHIQSTGTMKERRTFRAGTQNYYD